MTDPHFDYVIIGAGMAGASLGAELAPFASVLVLEAEMHPGYHATGRSAAFWLETYGGPQVQPLTSASGPWFREHGFLGARGALTIARAGQESELQKFADQYRKSGIRLVPLGRQELVGMLPGLRPVWTQGMLESDCCDIDTAALHAHYLAILRKAGGEVRLRSQLAGAVRNKDKWHISLSGGHGLTGSVLINAAGAWADDVAIRSGVAPIGIQPLRRTIAQIRTSPRPPASLSLVLDVDEQFYFKPESGRLWLSPHDETPSQPCDAAPEELDIAKAIDRFGQVTDWTVEAVERSWAGLRSFATDRVPVYGYDPKEPAFFWFAGQGGFGIQTAPAAARLATQIMRGLPADEMTRGIDLKAFCPSRFR
ncbi:MAG: NAD(P)/FAD-dependent oxidoreductase [Sphingomonadaceae bacterium]